MQINECCVLVIDDEQGVREVISESLKLCGFKVLKAENGKNAVDLIDQGHKPDVVITDIIMPEQDGIETILTIRKRYPDVKLVAISGGGRMNNMDFLSLAENLGADVTMPKPLDIDKLENILKEMTGTTA